MNKETQKVQCKATLEQYIKLWQNPSRRTLPLMEECFDPNIHYQNPNIDIVSPTDTLAYIEQALDNFDRIGWKCNNQGWAERGDELNAYLQWICTYQQGKKETQREGITEITFALNGKIIMHKEYWGKKTTSYAGTKTLLEQLIALFKR